jgi:hypothetical protein
VSSEALRAEGIERLAGGTADRLRAAFEEHRGFETVVAEEIRTQWPDPRAPSLADFFGEFPAAECSATLQPFGESPVPHSTAITTHQRGGQILIRPLPIPEVIAWEHALADELANGQRYAVSALLSVGSAGLGLDWHHDLTTGLLVLQLSGEKRWWIAPAEGAIGPHETGHSSNWLADNPMTEDERTAFDTAIAARSREVVFTAGTLAYVPPYHWHRTEGLGESWSLVFTVRRGDYASRAWSALDRSVDPTERWPEVEPYDRASLDQELDRRWHEVKADALDDPREGLVPPTTMFVPRDDKNLRLTRRAGGYWWVEIRDATGDARGQLVSKALVPLLRWIGTRQLPFSGYLARAHNPSLPPTYTDRLLTVLCERGFLTRADTP